MAATHFSGPICLGSSSVETLTAADTLTAEDNGKVFFLNLAGGFTVTLPAVASSAGYRVKFVVITAPTTAYIVASAEGDNIFGGFDTSADGTAVDSEVTGGADQVNFVASTAVIGDYLELVSDGTSWYAGGHCNVAAGMTLTG